MLIYDIFDWLFPKKCLICGSEITSDSIFCLKCFSKVTFIDYPFCKICGKILESSYGNVDNDFLCNTCQTYPRYFDKARALFQYDDVSKNVVMKIKNHSDSFVARLCAVMMFSRYKDILRQADCLVPVPSHWSRFLKRGFNPADVIAVEFSKIANLPICKILKRIKKTEYQKGKNIFERLNNVKNAFSCSKNNKLSGKTVILIDDVMTTGATLNECASMLKSHGCLKVFCLTIASTPSYEKYF